MSIIKFSKRNTTQKGFTIIEMMVAVSIFAIVVTISMGAIFTIVDANKKAQSLKAVMNNLNFALETKTRTIKTGQISSSFVTGPSITVADQSLKNITYTLSNKQIIRTVDSVPSAITAPEVEITNLNFIRGYDTGKQPSVVMVIQGTAKLNERVSSDFNIQTTITQRLPTTN